MSGQEERFLRTAFCPFSLSVVYCQKQVVSVAMLSCVKTHENDRVFLQACDACTRESSYVWDDACFEHLPTDSKASYVSLLVLAGFAKQDF